MVKSVIKVEGMTCDHCKMAVTKAVKGVSGVSSVFVNLDEGLVTVDYEPTIANLGSITESIEEAGYDVVS